MPSGSIGRIRLVEDRCINIEYRETFESSTEGQGVLYKILSEKFIMRILSLLIFLFELIKPINGGVVQYVVDIYIW